MDFCRITCNYLQNQYSDVKWYFFTSHKANDGGNVETGLTVDDKSLVQMMTALHLFMPRAGSTLSTGKS